MDRSAHNQIVKVSVGSNKQEIHRAKNQTSPEALDGNNKLANIEFDVEHGQYEVVTQEILIILLLVPTPVFVSHGYLGCLASLELAGTSVSPLEVETSYMYNSNFHFRMPWFQVARCCQVVQVSLHFVNESYIQSSPPQAPSLPVCPPPVQTMVAVPGDLTEGR